MKIVLLLCLVGLPADCFKIPTGCVKIWSVHQSKYLTSSKLLDSKRRHVTHSNHPETWIVKRLGQRFTIMHESHEEYLIVAEDTFMNGNHKVYTWIPQQILPSAFWEVRHKRGQIVSIVDTNYNQCLSTEWAFGWISTGNKLNCDDEKLEWIFMKARCNQERFLYDQFE